MQSCYYELMKSLRWAYCKEQEPISNYASIYPNLCYCNAIITEYPLYDYLNILKICKIYFILEHLSSDSTLHLMLSVKFNSLWKKNIFFKSPWNVKISQSLTT